VAVDPAAALRRECGAAAPLTQPDERRVRRCLLCGGEQIDVTAEGRFVTTSCRSCDGVLLIEFDPPDQPGLRARIGRLDDPD
jgi:hypothetical protein